MLPSLLSLQSASEQPSLACHGTGTNPSKPHQPRHCSVLNSDSSTSSERWVFFLLQETIRITHPLDSPPTVRKEHLELTGDPQPPLCKRGVHLLQERRSPGVTHPALSPYFWAVPACTQDIYSRSPIGNRAQVPLSPAWSYGLSQLQQSTASKVWAP